MYKLAGSSKALAEILQQQEFHIQELISFLEHSLTRDGEVNHAEIIKAIRDVSFLNRDASHSYSMFLRRKSLHSLSLKLLLIINKQYPKWTRCKLDIGIQYKLLGDFDNALTIFRDVLNHRGTDFIALKQISLVHYQKGDRLNALRSLAWLRANHDLDEELLNLLSKIDITSKGQYTVLDLAGADNIITRNIMLKDPMNSHWNYADELKYIYQYNNTTDIDSLYTSISSISHNLTTGKWTNKLLSHIATLHTHKSAGSFIRLGDGEGALLASRYLGAECPNLVSRNLDIFLSLWFGRTTSDFSSECQTITDRLIISIKSADFIGIPDKAWIKQNFDELNLRGCTSLIAVLLTMQDLLPHGSRKYIGNCSWMPHFIFSHEFSDFLRELNFLGLITCHEIKDAIATRFNIDNVVQYKIPNQKKYTFSDFDINELEGYSSEQHFPDVFYELEETIEVSCPGDLFLVGAGVLGKIYCDIIKRKGGIAIDIGSVFDAWMGLGTRHYIVNNRDKFRL